MSYDKQNWQTGDVITANKLNHIEDGIANGGGVLVINAYFDEQTDKATLDKTWQEIHDAIIPIIVQDSPFGETISYISGTLQVQSNYAVLSANFDADGLVMSTYVCDSADGYPVLQDD